MIKLVAGISFSGKSTFKRLLERENLCITYDLDEVISKENNTTTSKLLKEKGEEFFRRIENKTLKSLLLKHQDPKDNVVIFLGGGFLTSMFSRRTVMLAEVPVFFLKIDYPTYVLRYNMAGLEPRVLANTSLKFYKSRNRIYKHIDYHFINLSNTSEILKDYKTLKEALGY